MNVEQHKNRSVNYLPQTLQPVSVSVDPTAGIKPFNVLGQVGRYPYMHPNDDFEQVRVFWNKTLSQTDREHTVFNICSSLGQCRSEIQQRMLGNFYQVDKTLGDMVAKGLNMPLMVKTTTTESDPREMAKANIAGVMKANMMNLPDLGGMDAAMR